MQKKTHLAFGLFLASILFVLGASFEYVILIGFISFLPDIDWLMDKLWFRNNSLFKQLWRKIFKSRPIHRTFLHNVWVMIILMILFGYFSNWNLLAISSVFVGYFSHLLMDSLTVAGVYWLWPYGDEKIFGKRKFYMNGNFVTGCLKEKALCGAFIIFGGILFGYGIYMRYITHVDGGAYQIFIIFLIILFGICLMRKFVKEISKATSRLFK